MVHTHILILDWCVWVWAGGWLLPVLEFKLACESPLATRIPPPSVTELGVRGFPSNFTIST